MIIIFKFLYTQYYRRYLAMFSVVFFDVKLNFQTKKMSVLLLKDKIHS